MLPATTYVIFTFIVCCEMIWEFCTYRDVVKDFEKSTLIMRVSKNGIWFSSLIWEEIRKWFVTQLGNYATFWTSVWSLVTRAQCKCLFFIFHSLFLFSNPVGCQKPHFWCFQSLFEFGRNYNLFSLYYRFCAFVKVYVQWCPWPFGDNDALGLIFS